MSADTLLARLDGVRRTGNGRWIARCPAHADQRASLSVRELPDGRVLLHDFAGCSAADVVAATGLEFKDLFPARDTFDFGSDRYRAQRPAFDANAAIHALAHEVAVIGFIAEEMAEHALAHHERLLAASGRIHRLLDAVGEPRETPELQVLRRGEVLG